LEPHFAPAQCALDVSPIHQPSHVYFSAARLLDRNLFYAIAHLPSIDDEGSAT